MADQINPKARKVLEQKYGPKIRITVYEDYTTFMQLQIQYSTDKPNDLLCVVLFSQKMGRGTQYHIYEMTHSVFDPH